MKRRHQKPLKLGLPLALILIAVFWFAGYYHGRHYQCTEIDHYNNAVFTCDGVKIQGTIQPSQRLTETYTYHSSL